MSSSATEGAAEVSSSQTNKTIFIMRHAESANNEAKRNAVGAWNSVKSLKWPSSDQWSGVRYCVRVNMNSPLSVTGQGQVDAARNWMNETDFLGTNKIDLIVHSCYDRARDTALGSLKEQMTKHSEIPVVELALIREQTLPEIFWMANIQDRINQFGEWLNGRQEQNVLVVGHSHFWRTMLGRTERIANAGVWKAAFDGKTWAEAELLWQPEEAKNDY
eukprot:TRINITY_DN35090_c0_g1_i1.p2 TRINITY_DN35090_c0_g1~~TRINITY_DN35090_c0_g1_i1.p2  ORF type:complete len:218 (+),score=20.23 TRINITY_DN35090_c0_g1_i1:163-816(+)